MTFDRSKVVDGLCDNLEQWIGWEGYFFDDIVAMKNSVEIDGDYFFSRCEKVPCDGVNCFKNSNDDCTWLFYPVNPPKEKAEKKLVPLDTCQELIDWYCKHEGLNLSKNQLPSIWVRFRDSEAKSLITDFYIDSVRLEGSSGSLKELFDEYKLLDGTPIGKEVEND